MPRARPSSATSLLAMAAPLLILGPCRRRRAVADCVFFPGSRRTRGCPSSGAAMPWLLLPRTRICPLGSPRYVQKATKVEVLLRAAGGGCASTMDNAGHVTLTDVPGALPYFCIVFMLLAAMVSPIYC